MRFLLIENDNKLMTNMSRYLRREGHAVDTVKSTVTGYQMAMIIDYDLILLDIDNLSPNENAFAMCYRLRMNHCVFPILLISHSSEVIDKVTGLDSGADDYLVKPFDQLELSARIRALLRRCSPTREPILRLGELAYDPSLRIAWLGDCQLDLTPKELALLEYMLRRAGRIVSKAELLDHIWDAESEPFPSTIRVHIFSLRRKLNAVNGSTPFIETVPRQGYRLASQECCIHLHNPV